MSNNVLIIRICDFSEGMCYAWQWSQALIPESLKCVDNSTCYAPVVKLIGIRLHIAQSVIYIY